MEEPHLAAAMTEAIDPMALMQRVTDRTLELISGSTGVMVGLVDDEGITYVCGAGRCAPFLGTRVPIEGSLSGLAVRTGETLRSHDTQFDDRVDAEACRRLSVVSLVCVPLSTADGATGVLAVNAETPGAFTDDDVATLARLASFISTAIRSAHELHEAGAELMAWPDAPGPGRGADADAASRYVMSILRPDAVHRFESDERVQRVLDAPHTLAVAFQPIVDLETDDVRALEALARFAGTPYRPPDVWFDEAHRVGRGVELELLAVARGLSHLPAMPDEMAMTVNIGPEAVLADGFAALFDRLDPGRVIVELTEHAVVQDYPRLVGALRRLRRDGLRLAIDDTGSGISSLSHILKVAPDLIKLDRELTAGIDLDPVRRALASSLVAFAAETGAQIVAEGIETPGELEVVRMLGIRYAQGFHLARPAALDTVLSGGWGLAGRGLRHGAGPW